MALTRAFLNGVNYDDVNNLTKPIIINGDMNISQRYTSKTGITSETKLADRWTLNIGSSGTHTYSQGTGPGTFGLTKCIKIDCTSANNSASDADANMYITTALEGHDVQLFRKGTSDAKAFTISFFVRSNVTGTGVVEFWDRDNDRNIIRTYTIDSADTWERKVLNYDMETSNAFTDDFNKSVNIGWWIESGSDFDGGTAQTSWGSRTDANRAVGQNLNIASSTDNEFLLTGCMIVPGTFDSETIPDYPIETTEQNLYRCQRYCMVVGSGDANYQNIGVLGLGVGTTIVDTIQPLHPPMRAEPSMSNSGNLQASNGSSGFAATAIAITSVSNSRQSAGIRLTVGSGLTAGDAYRIEQANSSSSVVFLEAEI